MNQENSENSGCASRKARGEIFKSYFNQLWTKAYEMNGGNITYLDMVRIVDAARFDAKSIFGENNLPQIIDANLQIALGLLDPNKISQKNNIKQALSLAGGATGIGIVTSSLVAILSPAVWTSVAVFFAGGVAGGIIAPIGIITGLSILFISVWRATQKMTPQERVVKCHSIVMNAINKWVEKDNIKQDFTYRNYNIIKKLNYIYREYTEAKDMLSQCNDKIDGASSLNVGANVNIKTTKFRRRIVKKNRHFGAKSKDIM